MKEELHYRCTSTGKVNNNLKNSCDFSYKFEHGTHHCPLCGSVLEVYDPELIQRKKN